MTTLLRDDFDGNSLNTTIWNLPEAGDSSFLGRTQLRLDEAPLITNGVARLRLDSFIETNANPPAGQIPAFLGAEIRTRDIFDLKNSGYAFEARSRVVNDLTNPISRGLVAALFSYALNGSSSILTRDEIDIELLTNRIDDTLQSGAISEVLTNVFDNDPFDAAGDFDFIEQPGLDLTEFNTFRFEWYPNEIRWFINGDLVRVENEIVPADPMDLRLNVWAPSEDFVQAYDPDLQPALSLEDNQTFFYEVDYVQVESLQIDSFDFSDFSNINGLKFNGLAQQIDNRLQLVPSSGTFRRGSAFWSTAFELEDNTNFSTHFEYQFTGGRGDGFVFMFQNDPSDVMALGLAGGNLGFQGSNNSQRISPSVGIEFDTYRNGQNQDPNGSHIGVNLNGSVISQTTEIPAFDLVNSSEPVKVWIDYKGASDLLQVYLNTMSVKPLVPTLTYSVDLPNILGSETFIGFSAATGGSRSNTEILNWNFESSLLPDLVGQSFNIVEDNLDAGDSFDIIYNIANNGIEADPFKVKFYLSRNDFISISGADLVLGSDDIGGVDANDSTGDRTINLTLPDSNDPFWKREGDYYIGMFIDAHREIEESVEGNNRNQGQFIDLDKVNISFNRELPDLVGQSFNVVEDNLEAGDTVSIDYSIENNGGAASPFKVKFYLSRNDFISISGADLVLGSDDIGGVDANDSTGDRTINLTLPDSNDPFWKREGDYYIGMFIDAHRNVEESLENNNRNQGQFIDLDKVNILVNRELPDLVGQSFNVVEDNLEAGDSVTVDYSIENNGGAAGPFKVKFYLSRNDFISKGDFLLDTVEIDGIDANSNTGDRSINLTLPNNNAPFWRSDGHYYIGMIIDAHRDVEESLENNNRNQGQFIDLDKVNILVNRELPDLVGQSFNVVEENLEAGDSVTVDYSLENNGGAADSFDELHVSNAAELDGNLNVSLVNSYTPELGDSFDILTFGSRLGDFANINLPTLSGDLAFNAQFTGNSLNLEVVNI